jgi:hypothetical protein
MKYILFLHVISILSGVFFIYDLDWKKNLAARLA